MSSHQSSYDYFTVEEPRTPPSYSSTAETHELTRSARRLNLANDVMKDISRTKSGFVPRRKASSSRVDDLETELSLPAVKAVVNGVLDHQVSKRDE